jgi:hypothetical protein
MKFVKKSSLAVIAILAVVFSFSTLSFAKTKDSRFPSIKIDNFGQMESAFTAAAGLNKRTTKVSQRSGLRR